MYTSYIGKKFIELYQRRKNIITSAKQYFESELFPLFYDNTKYLQSPANTPLFQLIAQRKTHLAEEREKKKREIAAKIDSFSTSQLKQADMSFAIGYPSADLHGTTSGQLTSINFPFEIDEIYASWIGAAFGIGIKGGYNILSDNEIILDALCQGWKIYRSYVNENSGIDNKIESWNSVWLPHRFGEDWDADHPTANFQPVIVNKGGASIDRSSWVKVVFALARKIPKELIAYVYSLGQMNKTLGFVQIKLPDVKKLSDLYKALFEPVTGLPNKRLISLYETEYGFNAACERFGTIGLRAMEPRDLRKFIPSSYEKSFPKLKTDENSIINYSIYITWIIAMLNNKELLELAEKSAFKLKDFIAQEKKARRNRSNAVEKFLSSKSRKEFIDGLTEIVNEDNSMSDISNELVNQIMLNIAPDNLTLFVTLLRFKYLSQTN
jgi:hypothetical protein